MIRIYTCIASLLMLLCAECLARICRMRADQVAHNAGGRVTIAFHTVPIRPADARKAALFDLAATMPTQCSQTLALRSSLTP